MFPSMSLCPLPQAFFPCPLPHAFFPPYHLPLWITLKFSSLLKFEDIEKQRKFEEALLADVSAEEQEAKWKEAEKEAVRPLKFDLPHPLVI